MARLSRAFFLRTDVVQISRDLLGRHLFTHVEGGPLTGGRIVETEAYGGACDRACHAYGNRRTARTEVMFREGGVAYVYLCYGLHTLLNIVTNRAGVPEAVLIRAIEPTHGIPAMLKRRHARLLSPTLTAGPGSLTQALGIDLSFNGRSVRGRRIWIEDTGESISPDLIVASRRIGVSYAGPDAKRPWRFRLADSPWTGRAK